MVERDIQRRLIHQLRHIDARSIEDAFSSGIPDINTAYGWIELKFIRAYPKRDSTPIKIHHFTANQKLFLFRRWSVLQGGAFLLVRIEKDWFLFAGKDSYDIDTWTHDEWKSKALWSCHKRMNIKGLVACLKKTIYQKL